LGWLAGHRSHHQNHRERADRDQHQRKGSGEDGRIDHVDSDAEGGNPGDNTPVEAGSQDIHLWQPPANA
jgi:hypothetical protein